MRISFDLDDTLICRDRFARHEVDRVPFILRAFWREPLRLGARLLLRKLRQQGHEIWIYTSSDRQPWRVKLWLLFYGVNITKVINYTIHDRHLKRSRFPDRPSKNPRLFDIDLHIDDAPGVKLEGDKYGFNVLIIDPQDLEWVERVIQAVDRFNR